MGHVKSQRNNIANNMYFKQEYVLYLFHRYLITYVDYVAIFWRSMDMPRTLVDIMGTTCVLRVYR